MKNLLILGGTGFVGRAVCAQLVNRSGGAGGTVRVATRRLPHGRAIQSLPTVELREADVHDDAALARLLADRDAVINLVAVLHGDEARFQKVHVDLPRRLAQACRTAGVRRLVHVSALGVGPEAPSMYLKSKRAGEAALRTAGLDLTVLRPSVIFGAQDKFLNLFAGLQAVFPFMPLAGAQARFQPVWVQDVASGIVRSLDLPQSIGKTYECAGPDVLTLAQIVTLAGRWAGHERRVIALPDGLGRLQARMMELLPGEPLMSRDNLVSMQVPNVATGTLPRLDALGVEVSSMESVASLYLGGGMQALHDERRAAARRSPG
jgi:uncharacterized protein YbjT (DUF2867 family)